MEVIETTIADVKILEPKVFGDHRGFFMETFRDDWFKKHVSDVTFVQENHSRSSKGTLRGLHYQTNRTQGKLVRVTYGEVIDVAVDMRQSSSTFGSWISCKLSADNKKQLWVPEGFAHGFYVLSDVAELVYKCTDYYDPQSEVSILWDDAELDINWEQSAEVLLSDKDQAGMTFQQAPKF